MSRTADTDGVVGFTLGEAEGNIGRDMDGETDGDMDGDTETGAFVEV